MRRVHCPVGGDLEESVIDRSKSYEFNTKIYKDGMRARRKGRTLLSNPWPGNTNAYRSWNAGWMDQDENETTKRDAGGGPAAGSSES